MSAASSANVAAVPKMAEGAALFRPTIFKKFYHEGHKEHEVQEKSIWFSFVSFVSFVVNFLLVSVAAPAIVFARKTPE